MRWILLLALVLNTPALAQERTLIACNAEGKAAADSVDTGGSSLGGFVGGLFLGLIGTGIAVVVQSEPEVPYHLLPEGDECSYAFSQGYANKGKSRKQKAALGAGLAGTAALLTVIYLTQRESD